MPLSGDGDSMAFVCQCGRSSSSYGSDESLNLGSRICVCIYWFCLVLHCCRAPLALVVSFHLLATSKPVRPIRYAVLSVFTTLHLAKDSFSCQGRLEDANSLARRSVCLELCPLHIWWSGRDLNPRPQRIHFNLQAASRLATRPLTLTAWGRTSHSARIWLPLTGLEPST